ncbi:C4-dicarboxylate TRAP transporter substrate-binding protein [Pseudooceanicola sp.]|uniref:C4-dicarboxylate TRAP transporter substrate-binding protein n=1 Tax=Pseudooceanicola sp. TaxID=1914328 RepID=UPI0026367D74|nr:C4-dicarboxylate TRAP transporter substrate-binding protein [Pseudooceanicola sp.]MDF1855036.1 C4-dicarboxylate TRAP transporter substrate-binding protein [Pseudooceanicola sp.]
MTLMKLKGAVAALALLPAMAQAENYTAAVTWNDLHAITMNHFVNFAKYVKDATNGEINFEVYTNSSLLPPRSALKGTADGIAQYSHVTGAYVPADLPLDNVLNDIAFNADDQLAVTFAQTEMKALHPKMQAEYKKNGVVFSASYSTNPYLYICATPIRTVEDLKGKKIRTGSTAQVNWVKATGGTAVSVPATEMYTGLQRGSVDCALGDATFMTTSFKLQEVAKASTTLGLGTHTSGGNFFNADFWQSITPEQRRVLLDQASQTFVELAIDWKNRGDEALAEAKSNGVEIIEPDETLKAALADFRADLAKTMPKVAMEERKVEDPTDLLDAYAAAVDKYKSLLEGVDRTDAAALRKIADAEIYSKIDVTTYGM